MRYFTTSLFHRVAGKAFRIYVNELGEEGFFVTLLGKRRFFKIKSFRIDPGKLAHWRLQVSQAGPSATTTSSAFYDAYFGEPQVVHVLFDRLWTEWPSKEQKRLYYQLVYNWHRERETARKILSKLSSGTHPLSPLWEEISALNRAILESNYGHTMTLYRGLKIDFLSNLHHWTVSDFSRKIVQARTPREVQGVLNSVFSELRELALKVRKGSVIRDFPFSSFTASRNIAKRFGEVDEITVPTSRVTASWWVGFGPTEVEEHIVFAPLRVSKLNLRGLPELDYKAVNVRFTSKWIKAPRFLPLADRNKILERIGKEVEDVTLPLGAPFRVPHSEAYGTIEFLHALSPNHILVRINDTTATNTHIIVVSGTGELRSLYQNTKHKFVKDLESFLKTQFGIQRFFTVEVKHTNWSEILNFYASPKLLVDLKL